MSTRNYITLAVLLVGLVILAASYFGWSEYDRLSLTAAQLHSGEPGSQGRKLFEIRVRKFFDKHENEIEQLRELILSEQRACSVGFTRIGDYQYYDDKDSNKQWTLMKTLDSSPEYCSQEHALSEMMISSNRYALYLDLLRKTGFKNIRKSLSSDNIKFDSSHYAEATDDPKYRHKLITADKRNVYVELGIWFLPVKPWYFMIYVPDNAPAPRYLEQHIKGNWCLTTG